MTIEKLPSGSYRIRQTINKRRYSVTVPYKPSKKEAFELIQDKVTNRIDNAMTFQQAAEKYMEAKSNVLSPSTIKAYDSMLRALPTWYKDVDISNVDNYMMQKLVNELSTSKQPKTVRNTYGFCTAVIRLFLPQADIKATCPAKIRKEIYTPSLEDVRRLLEDAKDTDYYIAFYLASRSLRRGEIMALTLNDLDDTNHLTISKSMVQDKTGQWIVKPTPKTDASNRSITIPPEIADRIRQQGFIYNHNPNALDNYLRRRLPKLGIPMFSLHKLRHFFVSYGHDLGYSDQFLQEEGGYATPHVMQEVYRHAMNKSTASNQIMQDFPI